MNEHRATLQMDKKKLRLKKNDMTMTIMHAPINENPNPTPTSWAIVGLSRGYAKNLSPMSGDLVFLVMNCI